MFRRNWRDPGYWRWWWLTQARPVTKLTIAFVVAAGLAYGGFLVVDRVAGASPVDSVAGAVYTITRERATTVREPGKDVRVVRRVTVQQVVYRTQTASPHEVTVTGPTRTVVGASRTRTVFRPGETIVQTERVPVKQVHIQPTRRVVTRRQTVTTPVTVPTTVTQTATQVQTVTVSQRRPITVTVPVTVPSTITIVETTVTVTVTVPKH